MLIYKGFIGQIDYDSEANLLVGEIVNSVDLLEFSGHDVNEIKASFHRCVDEYLILQKEDAGINATPFVGNFSVCLSTDKQSKVIQAAKKQGETVSHWLNKNINSHLNQLFKDIA